MAKILIVEDETDLAQLISNWLQRDKHLVELAYDGEEGLRCLRSYQYDLVILDLMLPLLNGLEICQHYRRNLGSIPIMMLTAKNSVQDKELGLDSGADDYLTKPFDLKELAARVRALLRRGTSNGDRYRLGNVVVDVTNQRITKNGSEIRLLPQEYRLLDFLVRHPQRIFNAEQLLSSVWGSDSVAMVDTVRGHIQRIRKKLDSPGAESIIITVYGLGYKVEAERC